MEGRAAGYDGVIVEMLEALGEFELNKGRKKADIVLMAETKQGIQQLVNAADEANSGNGLKLNVKKTQTIVVSKEKHR